MALCEAKNEIFNINWCCFEIKHYYIIFINIILGHTVRLLGQKKINGKRAGGASLSLPKVRKNPLIEIIAINTGCLNQCTYCKTKHARGDLASYPPEEIVERAKQAFSEGVCEIWLTSEDTGNEYYMKI